MVARLTRAQSRGLAIGLLALLVGLVFSLTVLPIWLLNAGYQDRLNELQARLLRYQSIAEQDTELRRHFSRLQQAQLSSGHLLHSNTHAVAAAEMQRILKQIADDNETQLVSTQIMQPLETEDAELARIVLRVRARGSFPSIVQSIYALETNPVLLFLEDFSIQITSTRRIRGQPPVRNFETTFLLVGYMTKLK